jgi:hypothetical protein
MKNLIDLKSLILGVLLGAATLFVLGAASEQEEKAAHGRFQIAVGGDAPTAFVLDTKTGRVYSTFSHGMMNPTRKAFHEPKL